MSAPTVGSLFSGYGGAELALEMLWPDARTAWVSDIEAGPRKVLAHRFPDAPNLGDITAIDWANVEPVDIITGGSPCQDLSHAGRRAGMKPGTRSGLWASMCDAIDIIRPSLVIWENVRGALSAEATVGEVESCEFCMADRDGQPMRALGRVLGDLAEIGYDAIWTGLRAADVGACHGRFRVFVVAWPADTERERRGQRRLTTPVEASRGWASTDHRGRGGAPVVLPTPRATDGTKGGPNQRGSSGDLMLPSAVMLLPTTTGQDAAASGGAEGSSNVTLTDAVVRGRSLPTPRATRGGSSTETLAMLPTPAVNDMGAGKDVDAWDAWTDAMQAKHGNGNGHGKSLEIEVARMLPTPAVADMQGGRKSRSGARSDEPLLNGIAAASMWGDYAAAIARHARAFGRPAPAPTEPTGKNGANRLSAKFTEWMMGLPAGWVTDVPDVSRNEALRLCGNGIVPAQMAEAVRWCLEQRNALTASECVA